jgi:hypothetical protein
MKYEEEIRFKVDIFIFLGYWKAKRGLFEAWGPGMAHIPPGTTAPDLLFLC